MASIINASTSGAGGLIQTADSSGVLALQSAGATIASVSGTGVAVTGNVSSTGTVADSLGTLRPLVIGTAVASTSGNTITFSSIPSWVRRITLILNGVSIAASQDVLVQLGTTSGLETSGYTGVIGNILASTAANTATAFSGFPMTRSSGNGNVYTGTCALTNISGNIWVATTILSDTTQGSVTIASGAKTTAAVLDRVALNCGAGAFDAGSINIMYE
jgi:hypothetical protein